MSSLLIVERTSSLSGTGSVVIAGPSTTEAALASSTPAPATTRAASLRIMMGWRGRTSKSASCPRRWIKRHCLGSTFRGGKVPSKRAGRVEEPGRRSFAQVTAPRYKRGDYLWVELLPGTTGGPVCVWMCVNHCDERHAVVFGTIESEPPYRLGNGLRRGGVLAATYCQVREHLAALWLHSQFRTYLIVEESERRSDSISNRNKR
jgi:hypothetical protein